MRRLPVRLRDASRLLQDPAPGRGEHEAARGERPCHPRDRAARLPRERGAPWPRRYTRHERAPDAPADRGEQYYRSDLRRGFSPDTSDLRRQLVIRRDAAVGLVRAGTGEGQGGQGRAALGQQSFHGLRDGSGDDGVSGGVRDVLGEGEDARTAEVSVIWFRRWG